MRSIAFALIANFCFGLATIYFSKFSQKLSSQFVNIYKSGIATIGFLTILAFISPQSLPSLETSFYWALSGILGLFIGDIFLLKAFEALGAGRTLMLFAFQPLVIGGLSSALWNQGFDFHRSIAIFFLIACVLFFSVESYRTKGHWEVKGFLFATFGVILDGTGVILTRIGFEGNPEVSAFLANLIRAGTAFIGLSIFWRLTKPKVNLQLNRLEWFELTAASILGTFASLSFYLMAIKDGHLASISAIAATSPMVATLFETLMGHRKFTWYLLGGLISFLIGFWILSTSG